jgi:hypothetical protein
MTKCFLFIALISSACTLARRQEAEIYGRWRITRWFDTIEGKDTLAAYPLHMHVHFKKHKLVLRGVYRGEDYNKDSILDPDQKFHEAYSWELRNDSLFINGNFVAFCVLEHTQKKMLLELFMPVIFDTTGTQFIHDVITLERR